MSFMNLPNPDKIRSMRDSRLIYTDAKKSLTALTHKEPVVETEALRALRCLNVFASAVLP